MNSLSAPVVTPPQSQPGDNGRYHWTVDTFYRAIAAGVFDEPNRLELVWGDIWEKEKVNAPHAYLTEDVAHLFRTLFEPKFWVREEKPFHIASDGEPVPDIHVVTSDARQNRTRHPAAHEVLLVVEVADTSVERDTGEKALLYAQAGITDYWVSVVNQEVLLVYRNPASDGYPEPQRLRSGETITPLFAPDVTIAVADLLPRPAGAAPIHPPEE